ncbi:MAG: Fe-S cluster assembly protein HesB [Actinomycetota bacterium]|nr:Fe-S cluster assembly protein HesB [Actinomycetota bacterium]MDQ3679725.1 Fe-S cluster assembly protein HesB [Actinomycetota bacterium]
MASLRLSQHAGADRLLSGDPLALLIGMVLDQQIPLERAFRSPYDLKERLGGRLDPQEIAAMDPERLAQVFAQPPALHRFPASNAKRVQDLCRMVVDQYAGRAAGVWESARDGRELLARITALPGFGEQKARIFVALLGKQLGVRPRGWRKAAGAFGASGSHLSVADIDGPESLARVRRYKQEKKAAAKAVKAAKAAAER